LATGGTDFSDSTAVAKLKLELRVLRCDGAKLALHFAPTCATFSRARDRAQATQLRSTEFLEGRPGLDADQALFVRTANEIALHTFDLASWAARDLCAAITLENPSSSYLWAFLANSRPQANDNWVDLKISQCMFGAPYRKDRPGHRNGRSVGPSPTIALSYDTTTGHPSPLLAHFLTGPRSSMHQDGRYQYVRPGEA
jgi:hypothetical protein